MWNLQRQVMFKPVSGDDSFITSRLFLTVNSGMLLVLLLCCPQQD